MIIACTGCPAQYSVPDAKVQGKKVRVTCKHCGTGIIVDATAPAPPLPLPQPVPAPTRVLPPFDLPRAVGADDDQTRVMSRPNDFSVHEEPTVIGQIPQAALDAERLFAHRTEPPLAGPSEPPPSVPLLTPVVPRPAASALPHDVPEQAIDSTAMASPQAFRAHSLPPQPDAELETMLSGAPQFRRRRWPWVLGLAVLLTLLIVVSQVLR